MRRHDYGSREQLAAGLAAGIAAVLAGAIATRGAALLVVSGGTTPRRFLQSLSAVELDWARVTVLPADERLVALRSERSNHRMILENLLHGPAAAADLQPLSPGDATTPAEAETLARTDLAGLGRPDAAVLGMGLDGHFASIFPGGDKLAEALDPDCPHRVMAMAAPGAAEPRLTLTLRYLLEAEFLALHIEGADKLATLERAQAGGPVADMPVRALIGAAGSRLHLFHAP
jgi:6-phosphogluconolactonase